MKKNLLKDIRLYLLVDIAGSCPASYDIPEQILSVADMVQLRCKELADNAFIDYGVRLHRFTRARNIPLIINDRADIAVAIGAEGLHIGQDDMPAHMARSIIGKSAILGLSSSTLKEFSEADSMDAVDYVGIGPVFATKTKKNARPIDFDVLKAAAKKTTKPFFAIGGINNLNIGLLLETGIRRVCVSSAVFKSKDPLSAIKKIRSILYDAD